jgi:beta-1,4-mannooligosaccharide/beta-1,4-mannosyl-N-acetylglucosamine phosphorylase
MARIINGGNLPNMPWEDKPAGCLTPVWRHSGNPVIGRHAIKVANSVFNSAVVPFGDGYAGVFRCDDRAFQMDIFAGFSKDGLNWTIDETPIDFKGEGKDAASEAEFLKKEYRYDPRVCLLDGKYYVTWCNGYHGPTIGMGYTTDFKSFIQLDNAFLPYNRNGVLFPEKIGGEYCMLSRPSDTGHTPFGDIFVRFSPDLTYWGKHRHVMSTRGADSSGWQSTKIGAGPTPIKTDEGWLLIYHGVLTSCNGFVYRVGVALLDTDKPWKVLARSRNYILGPEEIYELAGDVPNVTFPCACLTDEATGRIAMYYGCADTVTGIAYTTADELLGWIR